jgi:hypothetical protein
MATECHKECPQPKVVYQFPEMLRLTPYKKIYSIEPRGVLFGCPNKIYFPYSIDHKEIFVSRVE